MDNALLDVSLGREVRRVTAEVDVVGVLVHTNPINLHDRRENNVFEIDETKVERHSEVKDDVLLDPFGE